jgi:toxin ParE1/3/4
MARVVWTSSGTATLKEIVDYLAQFSTAKAETVAAKILTSADRLELLPLMGRVVPEYKIEWLRELIVRPYRLVYAIRSDVCHIVAVHNSRRDLTALLRPDQIDFDDSPDS